MTKMIRMLVALALALSPVLATADSPAPAPLTSALAVAQTPEEPQTPAASAPVTGETPAVPEVPAPVLREGSDDGRRTMRRLPANLGHTTLSVFKGDNLGPILVGGIAAAGATFLDETVRVSVDENQLGWGSTFATGGGPIYSTILVAGMFTAGRLSHGPRFRAMTYDMLDAAIVNFAYTELIKVTVRRERPNGQDNKSFPSGHTSNAFALAAVAQRHYGWKIGVPAYLLAGVMGASRINQDKHWFSDVVGGAALGYIVGRTVVRGNSRPLVPKTGQVRLSVSPILARHARGLQMTAVF
jgi:membrane-associated phospholipid phosphatase